MPNLIRDIRACDFDVYDAIIDVRSEAEFEEDHIPGAINLPVLNNEERVEIGTLYVQTSRFLARRKGAAIVARNIAHHLETTLAAKDKNFRPLVYCWRGGNRSGAMATVFERIGWHTDILEKGYKLWRRDVVSVLRDTALAYQLILLDGQTGVGKTRFLHHLAEQGAQVLCLETIAHHKGSIFGGRHEDQPSQKYFESAIYKALCQFDPARPVYVEAESSKLGRLHVPKQLWDKMVRADRIELRGPTGERVKYLLSDYSDLVENRQHLASLVNQLRHFHSQQRIEDWLAMTQESDLAPFVSNLLEWHYDPLYLRSRLKSKGTSKGGVALADLSDDGLRVAAEALMDRFGA